jgi:signal transduction histidine kinase
LKVVLALLGAVVLGLLAFELALDPTSMERTQILVIFLIMAAVTAAAGIVIPRYTGRLRSLRSAVMFLAIASVAVVGIAVTVSAQLMFFETHDLILLLVSVGFGTALGITLAATVSRPLEADLAAIRSTAERVAGGDLTARTGIDRPDEVGAAGHAIDSMVEQLAAAMEDREDNERARRQFLAAVGHDLRSPLAALTATVEALQDGITPDPARYLRSMRSDLDAMSGLVDDLFLLASIEAGRLELDRDSIDVAELADESIEALHSIAVRKSVALRLDVDAGAPTVGSAHSLGRAIRNLVDNAIRFAPEGSEVVVSVESADGVLVRVEDEGPGFRGDMLDSAFDGFVTGDPARSRSRGGAGLGLAIARGVVSAHGGSIWAEAGPGGKVAFRLPVGSVGE